VTIFKIERNLLLPFVAVVLFVVLFFGFRVNFISSILTLIVVLAFYIFLNIIKKLRNNERVFNKKLEEMDDLTTLLIFFFLGGFVGLAVWSWANVQKKKLNERMLFITLILTLLLATILFLAFMLILFYPIIMRS